MLLSTDIYRVNNLLRKNGDLDVSAGVMMDYHGYESMQHFMDDVHTVFENLGSAVKLDEPVRLFRGIGVSAPDEWDSFDFWGLHELFNGQGRNPRSVLSDPGLAFATPHESTARVYDGSHARKTEPLTRILLDLTVHRGLCIPASEHRSKALTHLFRSDSFLRRASPQVIIPPNTTWTVDDVVPIDDSGWSRLALTQVD